MLEQRGIESFLPLVSRVREWKDRKKEVAFPLFPSYVFARVALNGLHQVLSVPGVANVMRNNGAPVAIADDELENVGRLTLALVEAGVEPEKSTFPRREISYGSSRVRFGV